MAGETMRFRNPAGHAGLLHNLLALVNALAGFLESRIGLFAKESKTALVHVVVLLGCLVGAAVLALFGYVFLIASAIAALAHGLQISWIWISLARGRPPFHSGAGLSADRSRPDEEINV